MKKGIILAILIGLILIGGFYVKKRYADPRIRLFMARNEVSHLAEKGVIQNGDLIFQTSLSRQSLAIQLATHSKYSHCGLIYKIGDKYFVFEAVQPVKFTLLERWIARGKGGSYVIKRLIDADKVLTVSTISKMKDIGDQFKGKNYDLTFEWSDDRIYCSELIWKIYKRATGLEIGKLQKLKEFDLTNEAVLAKMKERYGDNIPKDETVISPVAIFDSELLMTVKSK